MAIYVVLRSIHILGGVFWAGTVLFLIACVGPAVSQSPDGARFMQRLAPRLPPAIGISAALTMLSGVAMYWGDSGGFRAAWILSPTGLTFTIGAIAAIVSAIIGGAVLRPAGIEMQTLDAAVSGGTASAGQTAQLVEMQRRMATGSGVTALLLVIAVVAMASARYV